MLTPFLIDDISVGGMGLTTQDVGIIYGTFGVLALTIGGIIMEL
jgi:PAT family beta-lactamase induction signal transducer AmpG